MSEVSTFVSADFSQQVTVAGPTDNANIRTLNYRWYPDATSVYTWQSSPTSTDTYFRLFSNNVQSYTTNIRTFDGVQYGLVTRNDDINGATGEYNSRIIVYGSNHINETLIIAIGLYGSDINKTFTLTAQTSRVWLQSPSPTSNFSNSNFISSGLSGPTGIAFDNAGNLYVANYNSNTINKYSSDGFPLNIPLISGLNKPKAIAFDSCGNLYVVNNGTTSDNGTIGKYRSDGFPLATSFMSGLQSPTDIAFDSYGNLYLTDIYNYKIGKYTSNGSLIKIDFIPRSSGLVRPDGIAFDSYGNLYVSSYHTGKIGKYNSDGSLIKSDFISGLSYNQGITFDSYGNLYVANAGSAGIKKYDSDGNLVHSYLISGLDNPQRIAFDSFGNLYVSSFGNNKIGKYVTPISNICFPAGTPITTNQGQIPIEKINTETHTIRNKKIVGITQTVTQDKYLVCFEKDSLGINLPSQKTIISKNHGIFYKGKMINAKEFINKFENVKKIKYTGEILYNVLMEEDNKMMVNNLICETLHPENGIAKLYKILQNANPKEQQKIIEEYNQYVIKNKVFSSKKITK